jgi:Mg-chelatase subunit ChlI
MMRRSTYVDLIGSGYPEKHSCERQLRRTIRDRFFQPVDVAEKSLNLVGREYE